MNINALAIFAGLLFFSQCCHAHNIPLEKEVVQKACSETQVGSKSNWFSFDRAPSAIRHFDGNRSVWMVAFFAEDDVKTNGLIERDLSECAKSAYVETKKKQSTASNDELRDEINECLLSRNSPLTLRGALIRRGEIECNNQKIGEKQ